MLHRRVPLICAPTPLHRLDRMSDLLGIELWIKRDDLTGFAAGGNKGRKLEYLVADAVDNNIEVVVSTGSWQSNFLRQASAAYRLHGIHFAAVAMEWPHPPGKPTRPNDWPTEKSPTGNQALNRWFDADIKLIPDGDWDEIVAAGDTLAKDWEAKGKRVQRIPSGGSSAIGALGFVRAVDEIIARAPTFDQIIFSSGSGGTQSGITFGLRRANLKTRAIGICSDDEPEMVDDFAIICQELGDITNTSMRLDPDDFELSVEFCGPGYQVPTPVGQEAIKTLATNEAIFLDPVYTGKAFAGLMAMAKRGQLPGRTLFWHTGGFPLLFAAGREA